MQCDSCSSQKVVFRTDSFICDRTARVDVACARAQSNAVAGGTSIEELAEKFPDKIVKVPIDVREGITDEQARTHLMFVMFDSRGAL